MVLGVQLTTYAYIALHPSIMCESYKTARNATRSRGIPKIGVRRFPYPTPPFPSSVRSRRPPRAAAPAPPRSRAPPGMVKTRSGRETGGATVKARKKEKKSQFCPRHPRGGVMCAACFYWGLSKAEVDALVQRCRARGMTYPTPPGQGRKVPPDQVKKLPPPMWKR